MEWRARKQLRLINQLLGKCRVGAAKVHHLVDKLLQSGRDCIQAGNVGRRIGAPALQNWLNGRKQDCPRASERKSLEASASEATEATGARS
jgi:hypothetical protein